MQYPFGTTSLKINHINGGTHAARETDGTCSYGGEDALTSVMAHSRADSASANTLWQSSCHASLATSSTFCTSRSHYATTCSTSASAAKEDGADSGGSDGTFLFGLRRIYGGTPAWQTANPGPAETNPRPYFELGHPRRQPIIPFSVPPKLL